jgi:hypothetical protein
LQFCIFNRIFGHLSQWGIFHTLWSSEDETYWNSKSEALRLCNSMHRSHNKTDQWWSMYSSAVLAIFNLQSSGNWVAGWFRSDLRAGSTTD